MKSNLSFNLKQWKPSDFGAFKSSSKKLEQVTNHAGVNSEKFQDSVRRLFRAANDSNPLSITNQINSPVDVRACINLLANDENFTIKCAVSIDLLKAFKKQRPELGRLNWSNLLNAYFNRFDQMNVESLSWFGRFVAKGISTYEEKGLSEDHQRVLKNQNSLFASNAPEKLAQEAVLNSRPLEKLCVEKGLRNYFGGRFIRSCQIAYYIEQLNTIPVGEDHDVLRHIVDSKVTGTPADENSLFGHKILEILIDRSPSTDISDAWRDVIITIAGDPRVPPSDMNYIRWWSVLGSQRIAKVRGWLSKFDLKLFLQILESSAKSMNMEDRERMFESRKVFMEGLINSNLVLNTRLLLCNNDVTFLRHNYDVSKLPEYARVDSRDTSMIYLDVAGLHMIEGSHSFKVKIMEKLPSNRNIIDYRKQRYHDDDFRSGFKRQYVREYGNDAGFLEKTHDIHLNWQHDLINFMHEHRITIAEEAILTRQQYRKYRNKFGLRVQ